MLEIKTKSDLLDLLSQLKQHTLTKCQKLLRFPCNMFRKVIGSGLQRIWIKAWGYAPIDSNFWNLRFLRTTYEVVPPAKSQLLGIIETNNNYTLLA